MKILETDRLFLRELTLNDTSDLMKVLCDQESMKYYPQPFTEEQVVNWIVWNTANYRQYNHGLWAVIEKKSQRFIGDCGITIQKIDGEYLPEIGFHVISDFCNQGYATEAARACQHLAFEKLNYKRLYSYTLSENKASQKVAQKIGMNFLKKYTDEEGVHIVQVSEAE